MPIVDLSVLKAYFNNGKVPNEGHYYDLVDTLSQFHTILDVLDNPLIDYSTISTIVGWSSFTTKMLKYKKVGRLLIIIWDLAGTSNSTSCNFSLPYSSDTLIDFIGKVANNGTYGLGEGYISSGGSSFIFRATVNGTDTSWTASGTKRILGTSIYHTPS